VGFADLTNVWRSTNPGSGIGTNFGSIPFSNATTGKIAEERMSMPNSRIGARVDAEVKGARIIEYWEAGLVSSRAPQFRMVFHPDNKVAIALSFENPRTVHRRVQRRRPDYVALSGSRVLRVATR
jgi:hypothetical protein